MQLLLNDRLAPITSEIGVLEVSCQEFAQAIIDWGQEDTTAHHKKNFGDKSMSRGLGPALKMFVFRTSRSQYYKRAFSSKEVSGSLEKVLRTLLPLISGGYSRQLLIPTDSSWTAYFNNVYRGTDSFSIVSYLAKRLKCRGIIVNAIPFNYDKVRRRGRYGALSFTLYGPEQTEWLNVIRDIGVMNDGGIMRFAHLGTPFPFENTEPYAAKRIRNRFNLEMLADILKNLGLLPFEESFYLPPSNNKAILLENIGSTPRSKTFTLEEARVANEIY